ncbi:putative membrane peptidase YdiL [Nannochloris sp. 'desiccata']|nr:putative membrane peptidase YdiL [Chlorella desiccata (nom. nud.)]
MAMAQALYVQSTLFTLRSEPPVRPLQFARNVVPRLGDSRSRYRQQLDASRYVLCAAQKPSKEELKRQTPSKPPAKYKKSTSSQDEGEQEIEKAFAVFSWQKYAEPFVAPWSGKSAALGMLAWIVSFVGVGFAILPLAKLLAGPEGLAGLSQEDKAIFIFVNQVVETAVGIAVVRFAASKAAPLPEGFFRIDFKSPFRKPDGWAAWGLLGVILSPAVVFAAAASLEAIGIKDDPNARGTADAVSQLLVLDPLTFASLFGTTAVLAPILEETVFRGFLLPSLGKIMPTPLAVLVSAVAFGLVHLSPRDTPQLTALGILLGFSYIRSKNLLTPMMIHGAWNGTVLCVLYYLQANGVDVQKLIHGGI